MRRRAKIVGAAALLGLIVCFCWEFLQLSRRIPPLAPIDARATSIIVEKRARRMSLMRNDTILKTYEVSLGSDPVGHKQQEGDGRTPEGVYAIDFKNPRSRFHLALRISYPDTKDRDSARRRGVSAGSDIMIHGLPNGIGWLRSLHLQRDWTDGCIAVTNAEVEEIWSVVDTGTTVQIKP